MEMKKGSLIYIDSCIVGKAGEHKVFIQFMFKIEQKLMKNKFILISVRTLVLYAAIGGGALCVRIVAYNTSFSQSLFNSEII
jgi:hypothetical protein